MSAETSYQIYEYGPGNPLPQIGLENRGSNATRTPQYLEGKKIHGEGRAPIQEGGFIQIMALDAGEDHEVANLSRDFRWDGETDITEFSTALARAVLGQEDLEPQWYGNLQFTMYFEGDLDPEELVRRMVYSPRKLIEKYMPHLAEEAEADERIYEEIFLGENSKGQKFLDIYSGKISGQFSAYQKGSGRGFVWGGKEIESRKLQSISPIGVPQTHTDLAIDEYTEPAMRDNLLDDEQKFTGVSKKRRWAFKFTVDTTRPCCLFATASQSEALFNKTADFDNASKILQKETKNLFPNLFIETPKCSNCKQIKDENHVCQKEESTVY